MTNDRITIAAASAWVGVSRTAILQRGADLDLSGPPRKRTVSKARCDHWKAQRLAHATAHLAKLQEAQNAR